MGQDGWDNSDGSFRVQVSLERDAPTEAEHGHLNTEISSRTEDAPHRLSR